MSRSEATGVVTVFMTAPGVGVAEEVVRALLDERLVACGNIVPGAVSVYRWKGEVHVDKEAVVTLKTTAAALPALLERAAELHPYDVPELIVHDVTTGTAAYLEWVRTECGAGVEAAP